MQTFEFDPEAFMPGNQAEADKALLVKFFIKAKQNAQKTLAEGRPIFDDTVYVDIKAPGDRIGGVCRPATQRDVERFPLHYQAFLNRTQGKEEQLSGTPLTEWPRVTRSQVEELAFVNVRTVEQLANVADVHGARIMGINALRQDAKDWLELAKTNAADMALKEELRKRDTEIELLKKSIEELGQQLEAKQVEAAPAAPANDEVAELKAMVMKMMAQQQEQPKAEAKPKRKPGRPKVKKPDPAGYEALSVSDAEAMSVDEFNQKLQPRKEKD